MDKIYSRKRIIVPKLQVFMTDNNKKQYTKKTLKVCLIIFIMILTSNYLLQAIMPVFERRCETEAKSIATLIVNNTVAKTMKQYEYKDLVTIMRDNNGNITLMQSNIITINEMMSSVAICIQEDLNNNQNNQFGIALGSFSGVRILSGRGPKVNFKLSSAGEVETDFKSEFKDAGINQTLHRLYLNVTCRVVILTPFETIERDITNQVLLAENIIVGTIPNAYYNLEGISTNNLVDIMR